MIKLIRKNEEKEINSQDYYTYTGLRDKYLDQKEDLSLPSYLGMLDHVMSEYLIRMSRDNEDAIPDNEFKYVVDDLRVINSIKNAIAASIRVFNNYDDNELSYAVDAVINMLDNVISNNQKSIDVIVNEGPYYNIPKFDDYVHTVVTLRDRLKLEKSIIERDIKNKKV